MVDLSHNGTYAGMRKEEKQCEGLGSYQIQYHSWSEELSCFSFDVDINFSSNVIKAFCLASRSDSSSVACSDKLCTAAVHCLRASLVCSLIKKHHQQLTINNCQLYK